MKKQLTLFMAAAALTAIQHATAQSWNLAGNSNATTSSKLGTTSSVPLNFYTDNAQRATITALGRVGIGITSPINIFTVKASGGVPSGNWTNVSTQIFYGFAEAANGEFNIGTATNTATQRSLIQGKRARGTLASPAAVQNNDYLASIVGSGYDGSAFQNPAEIDFYADGTPSAGHVPGRISFVTGTSINDRIERLKIGSTGDITVNTNQLFVQQSTGNVGIGTITPSSRLSLFLTSDNYGFETSNGTVSIRTFQNSGFGQIGTYSNHPFQIMANNGTNQFVLLPNGNVGIGNANPLLAGLVADKKAGATNAVFGSNTTGVAIESNYPGIGFNTYYNSGHKFIANGYGGYIGFDPATGAMSVYNTTANGTAGNAASLNNHLTITAAGNIGIGTASPNVKAQIDMQTGLYYGLNVTQAYNGFTYQTGVFASNTNTPGSGVGVEGDGGYIGVKGFGNTMGIDASSYGSGDYHYAIFSSASGGKYAYGFYGGAFDGTSFNAAGYFNGAVYASSYLNTSDRKFKKDIIPLANPLLQLMKLKPASYQFIKDEYKMGFPSGKQMGLVADELKQVFPELVQQAVKPVQFKRNTTEVESPEVKYESINYIGLIPVVIGSIQEQQKQNDELRKQVNDQQQQINDLKELVKQLSGIKDVRTSISNVTLEQNNPNPLDNYTNIRYSIPAGSRNAQLVVSDISGKKIKQIDLGSSPAGVVNFDASALASGSYTYSIVVDGRIAETKKMVVAKSLK